jgi:ubiquitin-like domain-containing CTD phosphatase 1
MSFAMLIQLTSSVFDFREKIYTLTEVPAERQKLIGLTKGKLAAEHDASRFGTLGIKSGIKFTMIGTPVKDSFKDPKDVRNLGEVSCAT